MKGRGAVLVGKPPVDLVPHRRTMKLLADPQNRLTLHPLTNGVREGAHPLFIQNIGP